MDLSWIVGAVALQEGGWGMYPVFVLGILLLVTSGRYAYDGEPVRLRFVTILSVTLVVFGVGGTLASLAKVFWYLEEESRAPNDAFGRILAQGIKEASRPVVTSFALLGFGLALTAIGVYRVGRRELVAAKG
jgi:hypothetical protein